MDLRAFSTVGRSLVAARAYSPGECVLSDTAVCRWSADDLPVEVQALLLAEKNTSVPTVLAAAIHHVSGELHIASIARCVVDLHVPDLPISQPTIDLLNFIDAYIALDLHPTLTVDKVREACDGEGPTDLRTLLLHVAMGAKVNSHRATNGQWCLFPKASKLAHSCDPNTFFTPPGGDSAHCMFTATRPIDEGQLLTFSYLGGPALLLPTPQRQARLKASHLFTCVCSRCRGWDVSRGLPCPTCADAVLRRTGSSLTYTDGDAFPEAPWRCSSCDHGFRDADIQELLEQEHSILRSVLAVTPPYKLGVLRKLMRSVLGTVGCRHSAFVHVAQHCLAYFRLMLSSGCLPAFRMTMVWGYIVLQALVLHGVETGSAMRKEERSPFVHMLTGATVVGVLSAAVKGGDPAALRLYGTVLGAWAASVLPLFMATSPDDPRTRVLQGFAQRFHKPSIEADKELEQSPPVEAMLRAAARQWPTLELSCASSDRVDALFDEWETLLTTRV